ncbi:hypothetical protein KFE25_005075 [Diacronema lutheri]|uniref:Uncharacterized protein n=1 Tax=Diacronema lutheri TaxID=2081491 RepID=A0A7R9YI13_DIALT|nr:hypothetical protein KFE25_005075 [Diacronema lutheri]|mmetsp:Transcript_12631/g.39764  ORF Transcript_12631/g.39764 Transcript_12631/m.39764 type:complete len:131 (+) Transcript_12631:33-425(+)
MLRVLFMIVAALGSASAFQAVPLRASRVTKARSSLAMAAPQPRFVAPIAIASSLALLAVAEPSLAADFVAKTAAGGNQIAEFIVPAGAKASAQGILGPPGAILAALIGLYTAATLGTSPLKDGLPGRKMK